MTSNQHVPPYSQPRKDLLFGRYAAPANHWLRMIYAGWEKIRCLLECEDGQETAIIDLPTPDASDNTIVNEPEVELVVTEAAYTGSSAEHTLYWSFFQDTSVEAFNLALYRDEARTDLVDFIALDENPDELDVLITGITGLGSLTAFSAHFQGFQSLDDNITTFFTTTRVIDAGEDPEPVLVLPPNPRSKNVTITNTGDLAVEIYEAGALVTIVAPAASAELPMPGLFALTARIWLAAGFTPGEIAQIAAVRGLRCECGDVAATYTAEPVGSFLL